MPIISGYFCGSFRASWHTAEKSETEVIGIIIIIIIIIPCWFLKRCNTYGLSQTVNTDSRAPGQCRHKPLNRKPCFPRKVYYYQAEHSRGCSLYQFIHQMRMTIVHGQAPGPVPSIISFCLLQKIVIAPSLAVILILFAAKRRRSWKQVTLNANNELSVSSGMLPQLPTNFCINANFSIAESLFAPLVHQGIPALWYLWGSS